ncbi:MAG: hypothetical protein H0X28_07020 [Solirubrobacterales bacterium]|nr:hypothetical protein [Solirubrobacterales bacterium]
MLVPLAVGGTTVIGALVGASFLLIWLLMKAENRDEAEEQAQRAADNAEEPQ